MAQEQILYVHIRVFDKFTHYKRGTWYYSTKLIKNIPKNLAKFIEDSSEAAKDIEFSNLTKDPHAKYRYIICKGPRYSGELRAGVMMRDGYRCTRCGAEAEYAISEEDTLEDIFEGFLFRGTTEKPIKTLNLLVHHIKPWGEGGKTTYDNGKTLCCNCHSIIHKQGYDEEEETTNETPL